MEAVSCMPAPPQTSAYKETRNHIEMNRCKRIFELENETLCRPQWMKRVKLRY